MPLENFNVIKDRLRSSAPRDFRSNLVLAEPPQACTTNPRALRRWHRAGTSDIHVFAVGDAVRSEYLDDTKCLHLTKSTAENIPMSHEVFNAPKGERFAPNWPYEARFIA